MDSRDLELYASGRKRARGRDRAVVDIARPIYTEAQLTALKIKGAVAVGEHAMSEIVGLDDLRQDLANGDPTKNKILGDIELETVRQVKKLQAKLYDEFGI